MEKSFLNLIKKIFCLAVIISFNFLNTTAQDIHFSQNHATPLYVNPGLTGLYDGDIRITAAYRTQWNAISNGTPYRTITASFDGKIVGDPNQTGWLSGGLMLYSDKAGFVGFSTNTIDLSLAYNTSFSSQNFISVGAMVGVSQKSLDLSEGQFGTQFDGIDYDASINAGESIMDENYMHANLSSGFMFYRLRDARQYFFAGAGFFNILQSERTFISEFNSNGGLSVPMRVSVHLGGSYQLTNTLDIVPSIYYMSQAKSMKTDLGTMVRYVFRHNSRSNIFRGFSFGPMLRLTQHFENTVGIDALVAMLKLDYDDLAIGLSYDLNISDLNNATNGRGGTELTVVYTPKIRPDRLGPVSCPRF